MRLKNLGIIGAIAFLFSIVSCHTKSLSRQPTSSKIAIIETDSNTTGSSICSKLSWQNSNNSEIQEMPIFYWTYHGEPMEGRYLLKFELPQLKKGATLSKAYLSLYATPEPMNGDLKNAHTGDENEVLIQRITESWSLSTLTWNNQPSSTTDNQIELPVTTDRFKNYINMDVTGLINDCYKYGNNGIMFKPKHLVLYNIQNFASCKFKDKTLHPKLTIVVSQ